MIRTCFTCLFVLLTVAPTARAQDPHDTITYTAPMNIEFMSAPVALDIEPVTGAPYSADAVTDIVQTLSDGNRIVRQNKAQIARDGQGRTRREQGFAMFGPLVNGPRGDQPRSIQISDPNAGTTIMLDLHNKIAHRMPAPPRVMLRKKLIAVTGGVNVDPVEKINVEKFDMAVPGPATRGGVMFSKVEAMAGMQTEKPVVETLGTQFMEGIAVEGTRTTLTIPAGQIGNELPINIVSERWFSPDLKVLVMSRQSDPRFGETTYRLTNLSRAEPSPSLFESPADFKVIEPGSNEKIVIERKMVK
jgi:hypothetical protein